MKALIARYCHLNWALADQGMVSSVNFLTGIMLARYLGLEEFGRFTLAWMAVVFVNSIQQAVIVSPMMSIGPKQAADDEPAYYGAVAVQQAALCAAVFALIWGGATATAALFPDWYIEGLALPLACAAVAFQFQDFLRRNFFTRGRPAAAFATDALRYLGQLVILFWLFQTTPMDSVTVLWVITVLAALAALVALPACERMVWRAEVIRATTARHWQFSKWLAGSALMQWIAGQVMYVFAGAMLGAAAIGALRATKNLMGVVHILFIGLENIVPVRAARYFHSGSPNALRSYLLRVAIYGELATGAAAIVIFAAPDFWLSLAFGDEYAGYGNLLRWWATVYMVMFLRLPLAAGLRAIEQTQAVFVATALSSAFAVATAYPLINVYDATGAVGGIGLTQTVTIIVLTVAIRPKLTESGRRKILPPRLHSEVHEKLP